MFFHDNLRCIDSNLLVSTHFCFPTDVHPPPTPVDQATIIADNTSKVNNKDDEGGKENEENKEPNKEGSTPNEDEQQGGNKSKETPHKSDGQISNSSNDEYNDLTPLHHHPHQGFSVA